MLGEYALITGASSGIGRQIAEILIDKGYNLILCARRGERLSELKEYGKKAGVTVIPFCVDLSCPKNCVLLHRYFSDVNITIVVNSAGFGLYGDFDKNPIKKELEMISLNATGASLITRLFAKTMKKGIILNVCSAAAFSSEPLMASYAASKAYLYSYSRAVNYELKKRGKSVRVVLLCPGAVNTEFDSVAGVSESLPGLTARKCAKIAIDGVDAGKEFIVPTLKIKLGYLFSKLLPDNFTTAAQYRIQSFKKPGKHN